MKQPITIPFITREMSEGQMGDELRKHQAERIVYYTGESLRDQQMLQKFDLALTYSDSRPNVGTIGHRAFGGFRQYLGHSTYSQAKLAELVGELPYREVRSIQDVFLNENEVVKLWSEYMRLTEQRMGDFDVAKFIHGARKKEDPAYLGFDRGGLIVGGEVIWILPDKQYAKFHKKAADWVLPSKDYIKRVVARYFAYPEHNPEKSNIQPGKVSNNGILHNDRTGHPDLGKDLSVYVPRF